MQFFCITFVCLAFLALNVGAEDIFREKVPSCNNACKLTQNCIGCCADVPAKKGRRYLALGECVGPNRECQCGVVFDKPKTCAEVKGVCHGGWVKCPNGGRRLGGSCSFGYPCCSW